MTYQVTIEQDFKEYCKQIKPLVDAVVEGKDIQIKNADGWNTKTGINFLVGFTYRIKPEMIKVNGVEVPEPVRSINEITEPCFYVPMPHSLDMFGAYGVNHNMAHTEHMIRCGVVHQSKDDAITHAKAMIAYQK